MCSSSTTRYEFEAGFTGLNHSASGIMKASDPYWPLKSKISSTDSDYVQGHSELFKSNSKLQSYELS